MKYILLTLLLVFTSRLHAQELSIDKLNNQLNQHIESNDNENIIKTILDLKLILKKNKLVDPLTFIYLDARLIV